MKAILLNLANILMLDYCKQNNIDCSGTQVIHSGRRYKYNMIKSNMKPAIMSIEFHKSSVPTYEVYEPKYIIKRKRDFNKIDSDYDN